MNRLALPAPVGRIVCKLLRKSLVGPTTAANVFTLVERALRPFETDLARAMVPGGSVLPNGKVRLAVRLAKGFEDRHRDGRAEEIVEYDPGDGLENWPPPAARAFIPAGSLACLDTSGVCSAGPSAARWQRTSGCSL